MGNAMMVRGTGGGMAKIYAWRKYNTNETYTYVWNKWNTITTVTYSWNKYNSSIQYTWNRWNTQNQYTWEKWTSANGKLYDSTKAAVGATTTVYFAWSYGNVITFVGTPYLNAQGQWCAVVTSQVSPGQSWWKSFSNVNVVAVPSTSTYVYPWYDNYVGIEMKSDTSNTYRYGFLTGTTVSVNPPPEWAAGRAGAPSQIDTTAGTIHYSTPNGSGWYPVSKNGTVTSTNSSAYPNPGYQDGYWYQSRTSTLIKGTSQSGTVTAVDNANAYPNPGISGTYWYESRTSTWIKGTTSYGTVTAVNNSGAYPANGRWATDGYWYVSAGSSTAYSKGTTSQGSVQSTNRQAYPDNGRWATDGYWYVYSTYNTSHSQGSYLEDIISTDRSAHPDNGRDTDGYWYVFVGYVEDLPLT